MAFHKCCLQTLPGGAAQTPGEDVLGSCHSWSWERKPQQEKGTPGALPWLQLQGKLSPVSSLGKGISPEQPQPQEPPEILHPSSPGSPSESISPPDSADQGVGQRHQAYLISFNSSGFRGFFHPMRGIEAYFSLPILLLQKKTPPNHRIPFLLRTWGWFCKG